MDGQTACNQRMESIPLTRTCRLASLLSGTLQAKEFKNRCMQMTLTQSDVRGKEDCLYLNIWIPQGKRQGTCLTEIRGGDFQLPFVDTMLWSISQRLRCHSGQLPER